jgi:hypothetical protein
MARATLKHHTRLMAIGSHEGKDMGSGVIEVNHNVAGVVLLGIGQKIDAITLLVTCAQKSHHRPTYQLTRIPQSFSWTRLSCGPVNQADAVESIGRAASWRRTAYQVRKNPRLNTETRMQ